MIEILRQWGKLIPGLFNNMAVVVLCAYIFSHKNSDLLFRGNSGKKRNIIFLSIINSLLGIFGTINSIPILDVQSNIRNLGPIIAGLLGGPVAGSIAGVVSGFHRYILGGATALPCAIAAVFAGVFSGLLYNKRKGEFIGVKGAIICTVFIEIVHSLLILFMQNPMIAAIASQKITLPARIITESIGIGLFSFIIRDILKSRKIRDEKQKVERELAIAREIQMSILPKIFPPQPGWPDIEIYGTVQPAHEVAGDFFDFFKISESKICFIVGDVSDKGVPASLYMAVTKTLLKAKCDSSTDPADLLSKVNKDLCDGNESLMYVTLFCGFFDTTNGLLQYCNAGHCNPYLIHNSIITEITGKGGMALGVMSDAPYKTSSMRIEEGDIIFSYTDGVTDAQNTRSEMLNECALKKILQSACEKTNARKLITSMADSINSFQDVKNQFDDITLLALRWQSDAKPIVKNELKTEMQFI